MCNFNEFDKEVVNAIRKHIETRIEEDGLKDRFQVSCLREDVFEVLNQYCTVIYYPIEEQSNRGFHIKEYLSRNGEEKNFVFINTSQTLEKQVFTAAHELGHIWQIDELILREFPSLNGESAEEIINRFAAELLMPEKSFRPAVASDVKQLNSDSHKSMLKISLKDALKIIVKRMDQFRAPCGAVVRRLFELHLIPKKSMDLLLGNGQLSKEIIDDEIGRIIQENDYSNLKNPTRRKFIPGLAEMLEKAEMEHCVDINKINELRKTFGIPQKENSALNLNVSIETEGVTGK